MNSSLICHAFIDESGTVGVEHGTRFFIVAALCVTNPRVLELPVRRALRKYGRKLSSGELKAARLKETETARLLEEIAGQELQIFAAIVDQQKIVRPPANVEEIYQEAATRATYRIVERFPSCQISFDRRYTNENQRYELEKAVRKGIQDLRQTFILIRQESSHIRKELQAADAVSWAFFQKYERGDSRFYDILSSKIITEEVAAKKRWESK
ncbi:MAG: DUF3800 domain-containing protein [Chloroflexota bacterium]